MWHVSSRSGVATLRTAIHSLLTYLLTYYVSRLCGYAVDALGNLEVGLSNTFPTAGKVFRTEESYEACGAHKSEKVAPGARIEISCSAVSQPYRYVIVRSAGSSVERLCLAEVAVYGTFSTPPRT